MFTFFRKIKFDFFFIALGLIAVLLCYTNYTPHTYLSGWDTIHPEFNMGQYFNRITSVWQEHQGLGAPPSQAHAAEIPRMAIYSILNAIFPQDFVRYSYIFLMMIMGPLGVYQFLLYLFKNGSQPSRTNHISAFLGGLFYLLNLGTLQHFIVVLEMFATNFGFLGFIFLYVTKYLDHHHKKNLIIFSLLIIFSSSMAHTATLWYVFYAGLVAYIFLYSHFKSPATQRTHLTSLKLTLLIFALNSYWILPNIYYSFNYGIDVINSQIHRLFSEEAYLHNKTFGNISDILIFRNFLFNWRVLDNANAQQDTLSYSTYLMSVWRDHIARPSTIALGYLFGLMSIIGSFFFLKTNKKLFFSFLPIVIGSVVFLLSNVFPFSALFDVLRDHSAFFKEALRFPFTKLSIYLIFASSLFFAFFHKALIEKIMQSFSESKHKFVEFAYLYLFTLLIILFSFPAFQGNFISKAVRVDIPSEYFALFNWSQIQSDNRMLMLPFDSLYGWSIYEWNYGDKKQLYQGAGFTWFGLKQPTLNREFDRWYPYNEQSYREFSYALYSQNAPLFEDLLNKYEVKYIVLDESVIRAGGEADQKKLYFPEIKTMMKKLSINPTHTFGKNLTVYEYKLSNTQPVSLIHSYQNSEPSYHWNYVDAAYEDNSTYITDQKEPMNEYYPARDILNDKQEINTDLVSINSKTYTIDLKQGKAVALQLPQLSDVESEVYADIYGFTENDQKIIQVHYLLPHEKNAAGFINNFVVSDETISLIAVNDSVIPLPNTFPTKKTYLGSAFMDTTADNHIKVYNSKTAQPLLLNIARIYPYLCNSAEKKQVYGGEATVHGFSLYGQNARICTEIRLSEVVSTAPQIGGALNVQFQYSLPSTLSGSVCYFDRTVGRCLSEKRLSPGDNRPFTMTVPYYADNLENSFLRVTIDNSGNQNLNTLTVLDVKGTVLPQSNDIPFSISIPSTITTDKLVGEIPQQTITVAAKDLSPQPVDCNFEHSGTIKKVAKDGFMEYQTVNGALCETVPFLNISQELGFILAITSQYQEGMPMRICMEDETSKTCVIEDELPKNKQVNTHYFIIPPYKNKGNYYLTLRNMSIGQVKTVNRIKSIQLIPFPYQFTQHIKQEISQPASHSTATITEMKRLTAYKYSISYQGTSNNDLLVLDKAYEKNWKAYETGNRLAALFPFLFGKELKQHVLVNNWQNGWIISNETSDDNHQITIIFLPQYLQFAGYGLFLIALIAIFKRKRTN